VSAHELEGQVALVTGGNRGIGAAIARHLAEAGARVAVVSRAQNRSSEAAAALPGEGHAGFACGIADETAVDALIKEVEDDLGPLDILVNNAGVTDDNRLVRLTSDAWDRVMDTNLKGAFHAMRAVAKGMMRRVAACKPALQQLREARFFDCLECLGAEGFPVVETHHED
jgi:3-oxoacyl-[acyl-carrier protein] reductase